MDINCINITGMAWEMFDYLKFNILIYFHFNEVN
jgi:hypothetical protein